MGSFPRENSQQFASDSVRHAKSNLTAIHNLLASTNRDLVCCLTIPTHHRERVQLPDEDLPSADSQVGPRRIFAYLSPAQQLKLGRVSFDEQQFPSFIKGENAIATGNHAPVFPEWPGSPPCPPSIQIDAAKTLISQVEVDVVADHDRRGHVSLCFVDPRLFDLHVLSLGSRFEHKRAATIAAGENLIAKYGRRQNIHAAERRNLLRPNLVPCLQVDSSEPGPSLNDELLATVKSRRNR